LRLLCRVEEDVAAWGNQPRGYCRGGGGARRGRQRRRAGHPRTRSRPPRSAERRVGTTPLLSQMGSTK
jgi:hypothetical protein